MNNRTRYPLVAVPGALAEVPAEVSGVEVLAVALVAVAALVAAAVLVAAAALGAAAALVVAVALVVAEILVAVYLPEISVMPFRRLRRRHMRSSQRPWK